MLPGAEKLLESRQSQRRNRRKAKQLTTNGCNSVTSGSAKLWQLLSGAPTASRK